MFDLKKNNKKTTPPNKKQSFFLFSSWFTVSLQLDFNRKKE